ncbi:MAG: peptide chain release factor 2 [Finegoldia sp.]|nr:peptide chain release factor 2 [Finegoldia sp.]
MDLFSINERIKDIQDDLSEIKESLDLDKLKRDKKVLEDKTIAEGFWDDSTKAQETFDRINAIKEDLDEYEDLEEKLDEVMVTIEVAKEEETDEYSDEIENILGDLERESKSFKVKTLLNGEYDKNNTILSIHAGAGGTEAQDWAEMLLRMYTRWITNKGYKYQITEYNQDTEGGIKSVTLMIKGNYSYGFLKSEKGVHRLVRISPFDQQNRRHTSFASVDVYPEVEDVDEIEIDEKDLRIDTYRASGAGGQHVNMTDSAVRITHLPTGVVAQCQSERSQITNKKYAMDMLIAKLIAIKEEEHREKIEDIQGKYNQIAWGSQIRSYVYQPYTLVKDHRTGVENPNVEKVLDGDLDMFMNAYLTQTDK